MGERQREIQEQSRRTFANGQTPISLSGTWTDDEPGSLAAVDVQGNYAYALDGEDDDDTPKLHVINVSDPTAPYEVGDMEISFDGQFLGTDVSVFGEYLYYVNRVLTEAGDFEGRLHVVDVSTPSDPEKISTSEIGSSHPSRILVSGSYAYVLGGGLSVFDISDPGNPQKVGSVDIEIATYGAALSSNIVYVVGGVAAGPTHQNGLRVVNVSDPTAPQVVGAVNTGTGDEARDVAVSGDYAYMGDIGESDGLYVIDVSDPTDPQEISFFGEAGYTRAVASIGEYVYTGSFPHYVIDVSNPADPQTTGVLDTPDVTLDFAVENGYIYDAARFAGLNVLEFSGGVNTPTITSVEPDPVLGSNSDQPFTIRGSGFTSESTVTLRDKRTGEVFSDREISEQTSTAITINPTFTTEAATWTVEVINPDGGSSGEYEFEVVSPTVARYPSLSLSTATLTKGNSLTITGRDFTAGGSVSLRVTGPPGFETDRSTLTASSEGTFSTSFSPGSEAPAGKYAVSARDGEQGEATSSHTFRVEASPSEEPAFALEVTAPAEGQELKAGTQVRVRWADQMIPGGNYPTEGARRGYKYAIELSTGNSWTSLGTEEGLRRVGESANFNTTLQLPDRESESARIRITDRYNPDRQAESGTFAIQPAALSDNLEAELAWDYSFDRRPANAPTGVAADGVARIYLKLEKENASEGPPIDQVQVSVSTASGNTNTRFTGTVMPAEVTDQYSEEADGADTRSATNSESRAGSGKEFWFWYVAPKDFVEQRPRDLDTDSRMVEATFTATYVGGEESEPITKEIEVVRPPLMLVHGLAGSPESWDLLSYARNGQRHYFTGGRFLGNQRFVLTKALGISPRNSFQSNSVTNLLVQNGFYETLKEMRTQGYASSQVYYVGHSMGGSVARHAIGSGGNSVGGVSYHTEQNYGQGYVDRLITLNTPHAGSPWADFTIEQLISLLNGSRVNKVISAVIGQNTDVLTSSSFLSNFVRRNTGGTLGFQYEETDAVSDLRANGGVTFPQTQVPSHLIAGDLIEGDQGLSQITVPSRLLDGLRSPAGKTLVKALNIIWNLYKAKVTGDVRGALEALTEESPEERAIKTLHLIFSPLYGVSTVLDGDVIVSVESQLAGLSRDAATTDVESGVAHAVLPSAVLRDPLVGNRVFELLNKPVSSSEFSSSIPSSGGTSATTNSLADSRTNSQMQRQIKLVEEALTITAPQSGSNVATDSTLTLRLSASDTTGLQHVQVFFQNETRLTTETDSIYEFSLPVDGSAVDSQSVSVLASYERADSTLLAGDQVKINVTPASPIQQLNVEPLAMRLQQEQARRPDYEAVFEQSIADLGPGSTDLTATVDDPSVVTFNADTKSFRGESGGETAATISYRGKTDVLYFTVSGKTDTTREEPPSGLQVAAGQTGTFELGTTGAEVTISENGDSDGGQLQFARREGTVSTDAFEGSATAPDGSTISPNTASSRYWEITGEDLTDVSFKVRLDTASIGGIGDPGRLLVLKREDNGSPWTPLNTTREGETLVSSTLGSFSEFAIGGNTSSNPLPVELSSLDAVFEEEQVTVTWTTASETGNARFQIQRKAERERWTTVGSVEGAGTTSESRSYRFTDEDLPYAADRLTYRLRQVDTDGTTTLSDPVVVKQGVDKVELLATVPNPASRQARARFSIPERQEVQLRLYDALGREVRAIVNAEREGRHEETIDVSGLSSGTYFLRLQAEDTGKSRQVTVVR